MSDIIKRCAYYTGTKRCDAGWDSPYGPCDGHNKVCEDYMEKTVHVNTIDHTPEPDRTDLEAMSKMGMSQAEYFGLSDQSIKADAGKPKLTLVPQKIIFDIARVREYGLKKYGTSESWKSVDIQRYRDAAYRHFLAYLADPDGVDQESGLSHLSHLACNIAFLCEMEHSDILRKEGKES